MTILGMVGDHPWNGEWPSWGWWLTTDHPWNFTSGRKDKRIRSPETEYQILIFIFFWKKIQLLRAFWRQKCTFSAISDARTKKLFYLLFSIRLKYYGSFKTEYSDSTSFINRLSLLCKKTPKMCKIAPKMGPPDPPDPPKPIFWVGGFVLKLTQAEKNHNFAFWALFGHFWHLHTKIYFIHFFKSGKNIMSLLKRNFQFPPPS